MFALLILLSFSSISFAAGPEGDPAKDPKGFRDLSWGTSVKEVNQKTPLVFAASQVLSIGNHLQVYYSLTSTDVVFYGFSNEKLVTTGLDLPLSATENLVATAKNLYGEPTSKNEGVPFTFTEDGKSVVKNMDTLFWNFATTRIIITPRNNNTNITCSDAHFFKKRDPTAP